MKLKNFLIILLLLIAIVVALLVMNKLNYIHMRELANPNKLEVIVENGICLSDIDIIWHSMDNSIAIYKAGIYNDVKYKAYGNNYFNVKYKDSIIAAFHQFKHNNWHGHDYVFRISNKGSSLQVDWEVNGPDAECCSKLQ